WADVEGQLTEGGTWGRPSVAAALVARGHFGHTDQVFETLWAPGESRYYVPNEHVPETFDAIELIRQAGGVPIIAHPMARGKGPKPGAEMPRAHFIEMIEAGLAGFEVYHRDVPEHAREWLIDLAGEFDLILTGSSDYHGDRKHNVLGENTTSREMLDRILEQGTGTKAFI
ncbi:MAG: phosphatase, partial [Micrococcales bacterium]